MAKHKQTVRGGVWRVRTLSHNPPCFFKSHGLIFANKVPCLYQIDCFQWFFSKGLYRRLVGNLVSHHCF